MEDIFISEKYEYSDAEYCVKIGKFIPGGCQECFCNDITECPYKPEEIDLNSILSKNTSFG